MCVCGRCWSPSPLLQAVRAGGHWGCAEWVTQEGELKESCESVGISAGLGLGVLSFEVEVKSTFSAELLVFHLSLDPPPDGFAVLLLTALHALL